MGYLEARQVLAPLVYQYNTVEPQGWVSGVIVYVKALNLKRNSWGLLGPQRDEIVIFFQNALYVDANIFVFLLVHGYKTRSWGPKRPQSSFV